MTFGERLTELRVENGYRTRNDFAEKLGIPSTTLRNYETGVREPGHIFLKQISEIFNVSVDYLLGLTDEKEVLNSFRLKTTEYEHIKKYRALDEHGKEMVDMVLSKEHSRCFDLVIQTEAGSVLVESQPKTSDNTERIAAYTNYLSAAHNDHITEDGEMEKVQRDLSTLKKPE